MQRASFFLAVFFIIAGYIAFALFGGPYLGSLLNPPQEPDLQTRVDILKSLTEAIGIVLAGVWTYQLYIKNRFEHPYPKINHEVKILELGNGYKYLSAFITVTNEGKTNLNLSNGLVYVRQVLPLHPHIKNLIGKSDISAIRDGNNPVRPNTKKSSRSRRLVASLLEKVPIPRPTEQKKDSLFRDQSQRIAWIELGKRTWKNNLRGKMHKLEPGQTREFQFDFLFNDKVDVIEVLTYFEYHKSSWEHTTLHALNSESVAVTK